MRINLSKAKNPDHMGKKKQLSSPFSTGGGGVLFESHVQATFVTLMLTGGYAPCFPCWPIVEVKLQGKIDGFETDDMIVFVENPENKEKRKLLGQIKHSISLTKGDKQFGEVLRDAWSDINNPNVFTKGKDVIALITGPISATDQRNVSWLLEQARCTNNSREFYRRVKQLNFSPSQAEEKLEAFTVHLTAANGGKPISPDELYKFLRNFHLLGYDLNNGASSIALSLLHSHISQFQQGHTSWVWPKIVNFVQAWNKAAGAITTNDMPDDIVEAFRQKVPKEFPKKLLAEEKPTTNWAQHPDASSLALALLVGSWDDRNNNDIKEVSALLKTSYDSWIQRAREILPIPDSPLSVKNHIWKVSRRQELWGLLGSRILDQDLDAFRAIAIQVLKERNPAFELSSNKRYVANIYGMAPAYSSSLQNGLAEGLALIGSQPRAVTNCSQGKAEATSILAIREILSNADWVLWGSGNYLLPMLAEAAPSEFINAIEATLKLKPCPFDELFAQEGDSITGGNYLVGLLWALEGLAWETDFLVKVCVLLGELASHDPGGKWCNRPSNSLATILLPWLPQTLGSVEKRKVAIQTLLSEQSEVGWSLLLQLLVPQQVSSGTHKPKWRKIFPENWENSVSQKEYWDQISVYSELAVNTAGADPEKLTQLISMLDNLTRPSFDKLIIRLKSEDVLRLHEDKRRVIWDALNVFTRKHRKFANANWAFPSNLIERIEDAAKMIAPKNPKACYQHLFGEDNYVLYEEKGNLQDQQRRLKEKREAAVREIFATGGIPDIILFSEAVQSSRHVGNALGAIDDLSIDQYFLPSLIDAANDKTKQLIRAFINQRFYTKGWDWCNSIVGSDWTTGQKAKFLCELPFMNEVWDHVISWLGTEESLYWAEVWADPYQSGDDLPIAIDKLIKFNRPYSAIECLSEMLCSKHAINIEQSVKALLLAVSLPENINSRDTYHIVELIQFLQNEPSVSQDDLLKIEWAYLSLLNSVGHGKHRAMCIERKLASDSEFFCEIIRLAYRSDGEDAILVERPKGSEEIAANAWRLLQNWKIPPGMQSDGSFSSHDFSEWLSSIKAICTESGHLECALFHVGQVLIYTPPDPGGRWIHHSVASVLNDQEAQRLRDGFHTALYNSRGVFWVDPTGKQEKDLADQYRRKAEDIENAGFHRFAATLRGLAREYEREADER